MPEPRILLFDVETSPILGYTWGTFQQDVIRVKHDWHLLTVAWKFVGDRSVQVVGLDDYIYFTKDPHDDYYVVERLHALFDEADVVVGHNSIAFDDKKAQARMLAHGMDPPSPYREVDTYRMARAHFAFTSNRLDGLAQALGLPRKGETGGFDTWEGCEAGDPAAWAKMKKYNKQDVVVLEQLYLKLRPWMPRHPNLAAISDRPEACPNCGKGPLIARGYAILSATKRRRFQCKACGHYCQSRTGTKTANTVI